MVDVNPNPHEYGYVFVPLNRITAIVPSTADAQHAVLGLCGMGFDPTSIDVFVGEKGAAALDLSGVAQGAVVRAIRNLEALLVDVPADSHRQAQAALEGGHVAMAVLMDGREKLKDDVVSLLKAHNATVIRYWGRWSVESLG
jgi:hypothetical protein